MSASYIDTLTRDTDKARAALGDTDVLNALLSDEHITAAITIQGSLNAGIAWLAEELIATYAQEPVKLSSNGTTIDFSERIPIWRQVAATARSAAAGGALSFVTANYGAYTSIDEFARILEYWP